MDLTSETDSTTSESGDDRILPIRILLMRNDDIEVEDVDIEEESFEDSEEDMLIDVENDDNDTIVDVEDIDVIEAVESNIAQAPNVILSADSPEPGVENPIIRLENPHFTDSKKEENYEAHKRTYDEMLSDDSGQTCSVCLEPWTSVGPHRLCSLKCGHLFGKSCVIRWLSTKRRSACPQCNTKTRKVDIRDLYVSKLTAVDTGEVEDLKIKCSKLTEEKQELEKQLSHQKKLTQHYKKLSEQAGKPSEAFSDSIPINPVTMIQMLFCRVLKFMKLGEDPCRVLAYSPQRDLLAVSQKNNSALWPGYGVRLISLDVWTVSPVFQLLHKREIRDLAFHPENSEQLLSVAFDNTVKIFDVISLSVIATFNSECPIWCTSWDPILTNSFFCGSARGEISVYNKLCPSDVKNLEVGEGDTLPVIAVVRSKENGFILCCRTHSVTAYTKDSSQNFRRQVMEVCPGPFVAMCYDDFRSIMILACRPTEEFQFSFRHALYRVTFENGIVSCGASYVFLAGHALTRISRPYLLSQPNSSFYFAFNESQSAVWGWSLDNGSKVLTINVNKPVTDILAITRNKEVVLMVLTTNNVHFYEIR